jgi:hypothetical protein
MSQVVIRYWGHMFFDYHSSATTVFVDPCYSQRHGQEWRLVWQPESCEIVTVTQLRTECYADAVEVMSRFQTILVSSPSVCRRAKADLALPSDRFVALRDGERADADGIVMERFVFARADSYRDHRYRRQYLTSQSSSNSEVFVYRFGETVVHHYSASIYSTPRLGKLQSLAYLRPPDVIVLPWFPGISGTFLRILNIIAPKKLALLYTFDNQHKPLPAVVSLESFVRKCESETSGQVIRISPGEEIEF